MTTVPPLETARLLLPPFTLEDAHAVLADSRVGRAWSPGYPTEGDREIAAMLLRTGPPSDQRAVVFGTRRIVLRASGLTVGGIGFFGPPDEAGTLSVGYGIAPEVRRVLADTTPDNLASQRVLAKAGFQRVGADEALIYYEYAIAR